jgi:hypothetical protein
MFVLLSHGPLWQLGRDDLSYLEEFREGVKCEAILISGGSAVAVDEKDKENRVAKLYLEEWMCIRTHPSMNSSISCGWRAGGKRYRVCIGRRWGGYGNSIAARGY